MSSKSPTNKRKPANSAAPGQKAKPPPGLKPASTEKNSGKDASTPAFIRPQLPDEREAPDNQKTNEVKNSETTKDSAEKAVKAQGTTVIGPVLPPAPVPLPLPSPPTILKLGPGIRLDGNTPIVSRAGTLMRTLGTEKTKTGRVPVEKWHVERVPTRMYTPSVGDPVVLTILQRSPYGTECYLCSYAPHAPPLLLPYLAFENATRRNKPELKAGDLVYARVIRVGRGEGEVECLAASGRAEGFGELKGGTASRIPAGICRRSAPHLLLFCRWRC
jgi:hypothetical protein